MSLWPAATIRSLTCHLFPASTDFLDGLCTLTIFEMPVSSRTKGFFWLVQAIQLKILPSSLRSSAPKASPALGERDQWALSSHPRSLRGSTKASFGRKEETGSCSISFYRPNLTEMDEDLMGSTRPQLFGNESIKVTKIPSNRQKRRQCQVRQAVYRPTRKDKKKVMLFCLATAVTRRDGIAFLM